MEVEVHCRCGTRYAVDIEPINGKLPEQVACPQCHQDGTELANAQIIAGLEFKSPERPVTGRHVALRESPPTPPPIADGAASPRVWESAGSTCGSRSLLPGILGALIGGLAGFLGWYLFIKLTGFALGYIAWGVGVATGMAARKGTPNGGVPLGFLAGGVAFLAILGGEYFVTKNAFDEFISKVTIGAFERRMAYAKEAINLQTDEEIKTFLSKHLSEDEAKNAVQIWPIKIAAFRANDIPELKRFVNSPPNKQLFEGNLRAQIEAKVSKLQIMKSMSPFTVLWLFLGVGTAYKIAANVKGSWHNFPRPSVITI